MQSRGASPVEAAVVGDLLFVVLGAAAVLEHTRLVELLQQLQRLSPASGTRVSIVGHSQCRLKSE